jgi:hypothetical protein
MKNYLVAALTSGLVACGGGGGGSSAPTVDLSATDPVTNSDSDSDSNSNSNSSNTSDGSCNFSWFEVMEKGFACHTDSDTGGSSDTGSSGAEPSPPQNLSVRINHVAEFEPNNIAANANVVAFLPVTGDTLQGIEITGSVDTASDDSDYFIFTPDRSGMYAVYLCGENCTDQPVDSKVAIRVLDQFGDELAANPLYEESTKFLSADFDAGLPYYVQILGFDTGVETYDYRLVIIE